MEFPVSGCKYEKAQDQTLYEQNKKSEYVIKTNESKDNEIDNGINDLDDHNIEINSIENKSNKAHDQTCENNNGKKKRNGIND